MSARPVISHDTRALMAARCLRAAYDIDGNAHIVDVARRAVVMTDALISALGYQVMQPGTSTVPPFKPRDARARRPESRL